MPTRRGAAPRRRPRTTGYTVWWDALIEGGSRFATLSTRRSQRPDAVVVLWSKNSIESDWVRDEAAHGRDRHRLVPLSLDGSMPPLGFRQYPDDRPDGLARPARMRRRWTAIRAGDRAAAGQTRFHGRRLQPVDRRRAGDRRRRGRGRCRRRAAIAWQAGLFGGAAGAKRAALPSCRSRISAATRPRPFCPTG